MSTFSRNLMYSFLLYWCYDGFVVAAADIYKATRPSPSSGKPQDISVIRASPTSFVVIWNDGIETSHALRYQVAYRPVYDRYDIIQEADADKRAIILDNLRPGTRYQVHVSAVTPYGRSNHSDVVLFDTDNPRNESDRGILVGSMSVRPEEIGIVVVVLALWIFVIVLFFNKWGKIRMLEPYQPQYKHPRTPSCSHVHSGRLSLQLASFTSVERERLLYSGPPHVHLAARPRQNSVFVGNPYARYNLSQVTPSRKVKSAEDINSMVQFKTSNPRMQTTNV